MSLTDIEALTDAVMVGADRDRDRLMENATAMARRIREEAQAEAEAETGRVIAQAEAKAAKIREHARAAVRLEAQEITLGERESLLNTVFERAIARLSDVRSLDGYDEIVMDLVREAVDRMGGADALVIIADAVTQTHLDLPVLAKLSAELNCQLSLGETLAKGTGIIVQSSDGRMTYNNTFEERLDRHRSALRASAFAILKGRGV